MNLKKTNNITILKLFECYLDYIFEKTLNVCNEPKEELRKET